MGLLTDRPARAARAAASALALAASVTSGALSCSFVVPRSSACSTNADCRAAFGVGSTCTMSTGLCAAPQRIPRCSRAFPDDLLTNPDPAVYRDHIILGSIYSYTDHNDTLRATELAVRQVNANGGLQGRQYAIVHCDYTPNAGDMLTDVQATELITRYLVQTIGVPAVIGPRGSGRAIAAFNSVAMSGTLIISPSATSTSLIPLDNTAPTDENPGLLWRTVPDDSLQGAVIAADMRARDVTRVAVLHQTGAYGEALAQIFQQRFARPGVTVRVTPFMSGQLGDAIAATGAGDAEEVLFLSSNISDIVGFLNGASATPTLLAQYRTRGIFLADAAFSPQLIDNTSASAKELFPRIRGTRPAAATGMLFDAFAADFMLQYGASVVSSGFTPHAYDAAWLVIYGTAWSTFHNNGAITGRGIAQGLRRVSSGAALEIRPVNWPAVVNNFRMGTAINVAGASGALDYNPMTEETSSPIEVWRPQMSGSAWMLVRETVVNP